MKHKLIILALVLSLVFVSQNTLSLGMGKIQVNSSLDESLNATIDIIANDDESIDQVSVKLASADDYKKVGLDKSFVPSNILVSVDQDNPYQINVHSNGPVSEPIVSLLLDVTWANGRILREFTLLLDPPSYQASTRGSISMPTSQPEPQQPEPQQPETMGDVQNDAVTAQSDDIPPVSQDLNEAYEDMDSDVTESTQDESEFVVETPMDENVSETLTTMPGEVYVNTGDTLWRIANQNKPSDVSTHQMMMAIYDRNPDAFLNNNVNEMIKGSTLQMPDAESADDLSYQQALAEFESHNSRWATAEDSYSSFQTESQIDDDEVVADTTDYGVQLSGGEGDDTDSQQTEGDLANSGNSGLSEEEAFNTSSENEELKSRVSELESIVNEQQSALEFQDDDMANLETQMGQDLDQEVAISEGGFDDDETVVDDTDETLTDDVWDTPSDDLADATEDSDDLLTDDSIEQDTLLDGDEETTLSDSTDIEERSETEQVAEEPVVTTPQKPVQVSEPWYTAAINWIQENVLWVIIGLVVLFLIVLLPKLLNRGDDDSAEEGSFLDDIKSSRGKKEDIDHSAVADDEVSAGDEETILTTPIAVDDESGDDLSEAKALDSFDDDADDESDDVLAELDNSLAFDDSDEDDSDDFDFDFGDDDDETSVESEQSLHDDVQDQLEELGDDSDMETPTKEYDPAPFRDDDSFEDDFDLSDLDDDVMDDESVDDNKTELVPDEDDEQSLLGDDDLDLEAELSELDDDFEATEIDADDDQDDGFSDDDFLAELDEIEDLDNDLDDEEIGEDLSEQLDEESDDDFEESISLDVDDQATTFETDQEDNDMDDDEIDLGLDDLMSDGDVIETKLDLAKAYIEMGDTEGAKNLLDEVKAEGTEAQKSEANKLIDDM